MFTSVAREAIDLGRQPFADDEVQFNLFHRILKGAELVALQWAEGDVVHGIAAGNPGHALWLWLHPQIPPVKADQVLDGLCQALCSARIAGISAEPGIARQFAEKYARLAGATSIPVMQMAAYHCPEVTGPTGVEGRMLPANPDHLDLVAEFLVGFVYWGFGQTVSKESQLAGAERLVRSGNLYLWEVQGQVVSMAAVADRSPRHARINSVYTPPEQRGHGYASSLVATLSATLLRSGLVPMLYADLNNPTSNRIYQNIGFRECGEIAEYKFSY